jgi:hypothetical protein
MFVTDERRQPTTVHDVLGRLMDRWVDRGLPEHLRDPAGEFYGSWASESANPDDRLVYLRGIEVAWLALGLAAGLLMVLCAYVADKLAGPGARNAVVVVGIAAVLFCESGVFAVFYHSLHGYRARYWQRRASPARAARAARRATPRNSSLIWQSAVAVLAAIVAASNL